METKEISSQLNIKINVKLRVRNRITGRIIKEVEACNRVTNLMLAGIANLIYGDTEILNRYVPAYIAVGYCKKRSRPQGDSDPEPVPTHGSNVSPQAVEVTDTMLYGEIPSDSYERIKISGKTVTNNGDYVMVGMNGYIHSSTFTDKIISEVGLFTKDSGNNCIARVILDSPIVKGDNEVIDVVWGITSTSVANNQSNESENNEED